MVRGTRLGACLMVFGLAVVTPCRAGELRAGLGVVDITPPVSYRLSGYFIERVSTAVHDPLHAKAMVFAQDERKAALILCDVISIPLRVSTNARRRIAEQTGIPASHVAICATHTHTAPLYFGVLRDRFHTAALARHGEDPCEPIDYADFLTDGIVQAASDAHAAMQPVRLEAGSAVQQPTLSFNRRFLMKDGSFRTNPGSPENVVRPAGPIDPTVDLLFLRDAAGKPLGALTVFALHQPHATRVRRGWI